MRKLIANKAMSFGGQALKPGDPFDASHKHARVLVAIGKASDRPEDVAPTPAAPADSQVGGEEAAAQSDESPEAKAKRTYKRRDLKAE